MVKNQKTVLMFGASGAIGSAIAARFIAQSWRVVGVTRDHSGGAGHLTWDPLNSESSSPLGKLAAFGGFDAVCWAQGQNCNDSIYDFDVALHNQVYEANVTYVLQSLSTLIENNLLKKPAKLCVISSIWQNLGRQNKLSYGISKAAIQGLVLSLANDLGVDGHLINAVLPGALDTPMTHQNLMEAQLLDVVRSTQFGRLASLDDVANTAYFLCSAENTGLTGQFVKVDLGYSDVRVI